jgi:hypothetical protein
LDRLANLLLNEQVAERVTCLRLSSFRIDFHDQGNDYSPVALAKNTEARIAYINTQLKRQLSMIFRRATNMRKLVVTAELIWMQQNDARVCEQVSRVPVSSPERSFRIFYDGLNPLPCLQAALEETSLNNILEEMTVYTHQDWDFFNEKVETPLPETFHCQNVTNLTLDPIQLMNQELRLNCSALRTLELINLARLPRWRLSILHHRLSKLPDLQRRHIETMFNSIDHIILSGSTIPNATSPGLSSTSTIYALISYVARFTNKMRLVTIRRAIIYENGDGPGWSRSRAPKDADGKLLDDVQNVRDFEIETLELDKVRWAEKGHLGVPILEKNIRKLSGEGEVWERLGRLERLVCKVRLGVQAV